MTPTTPTTPPSDLRDRVLAAARAEPTPLRADASRNRVIAFAVAFLPLVIFEAYDLHLGARPLGFVVVNVVGWALLAFVATWGAVGRGRSMLGRPRGWLVAIAIAMPPLLLAFAAMTYGPWPEALAIECTGAKDFSCCSFTLGLAVGPLAAFAYARRESDPIHPRVTGAAIGVSAGAWAAVSMALHCPVTSLRHMIVGHVVPVIVFALIGYFIGSKVVAVRARRA